MSRRQNFEVAGYKHGNNPIPAVTRIDNVIMTGGVSGLDLKTGQMPPALDAQCENMFKLVAALMEAAGATLDDVIKVSVAMKPPINREALNRVWVERFPNEHSRPVRHVVVNEHLAGGMLIQCEVTAVARKTG